jgi:hypothetical protein
MEGKGYLGICYGRRQNHAEQNFGLLEQVVLQEGGRRGGVSGHTWLSGMKPPMNLPPPLSLLLACFPFWFKRVGERKEDRKERKKGKEGRKGRKKRKEEKVGRRKKTRRKRRKRRKQARAFVDTTPIFLLLLRTWSMAFW